MFFRTHLKRLGRWAVLAAVLVLPGGSLMAAPLPEPVTVKIDFFDRWDVSQEWLAGAMAGLGAPSGYSFTEGGFTVSDSVALVAANRLKAFYSEARLMGPNPWLLLPMVRENGEQVDCVTSTAKQMIPSLEPADFGKRFAVSILRTDTPEDCLIDPSSDDRFAGADRTALRNYFDEAGDLLREHQELKTDKIFIRALIEAGFYVEVQDASGNLRIG